MTKTTLASLTLASSLLAACHEKEVIQIPAPDTVKPGQMTVTGTATLQVSPDCADLTMTLSDEETKPLAATTAVDGKERALIAALTKEGVSEKDLKLSTLSLEPQYGPVTDKPYAPYVLKGYRAQIVVTATTRDFSKIAPLMEAGAEVGATAMTSQFRRSDLPELKKKVREMALSAAKDKAKQTATALGIEVGRVVSVAETSAGMMWQSAYFPQANAAQVQNNGGGNALGGELQPLTLDVTIGYELPIKA